MSAQVEDKEIDLSNLIRNYLKAAKRFWWILVACTVLFAGLLPLVMSLRHTPEYEATCSFTVRVVNNSVTEELNNPAQSGAVRVNGLEWSARSVDDAVTVEKGQLVVIREISGVKLICEPK